MSIDPEGLMNLDEQAWLDAGLWAAEQLLNPVCEGLVDLFSNRESAQTDNSGVDNLTTENDSEALRAINTEPQRRAYETVNYVLRNFGCRIAEVQLLSVLL
jgi:hypothetical protein